MFSWFYKNKKKTSEPLSKDAETLMLLKQILFPDVVIEKGEIAIDYSADLNLDAAVCDVRDGIGDESVIECMVMVLKQLGAARTLLGAQAMAFDTSKIKYFVHGGYLPSKEDVADNIRATTNE